MWSRVNTGIHSVSHDNRRGGGGIGFDESLELCRAEDRILDVLFTCRDMICGAVERMEKD